MPIANEKEFQANTLNQDIIAANPFSHSVVVRKVQRFSYLDPWSHFSINMTMKNVTIKIE